MKVYFSGIIVLCYILGLSLNAHALSREEVITQTLKRQEHPRTEGQTSEIPSVDPFPNAKRARIIDTTLGRIEFALAIGTGYLAGDTRYEINFVESGISGKSELVFPFDNWLVGGNISAGYYPLYLNFQGWGNIAEKTTGGMTDKDWENGALVSSTKSDYRAQIAILDFNLLYNFWQGEKPWGDVLGSLKKQRLGLLVGYRYENFKDDIIGVKDLFTNISSYPGQRVLDYEVQYRIPYLGLDWQYFDDLVDRVFDGWGVNVQVCGSPYVTAKDKDYHLLRNKLAEGSAVGSAFLLGLNTFIKTRSHWIGRLGFNYTGIWTNGKQNQRWYGDDPGSVGDDTGISIEGIGLKIESSQYFLWGLLQYNF